MASPAPFVELGMDQGSSFLNTITLTDDLTNSPVNVTNYIITSQMRTSYYTANATANLVCSVIDGSNGEIMMALAAANTANIRGGRYVFDVMANDGVYAVTKILEGIITVYPSASKS